jgi:hypothetical protein
MTTTTETEPGNDGRTGAIDSDAAAASSVIAKLRHLLLHQDILEHPTVSGELRKLEEQLASQLTGTGPASGRHRVMSPPTRPT